MSDPPRFALGIRHFLLYTAALGVNLTINRVLTELLADIPRRLEMAYEVFSYATAVTSAVSVAALALWGTRLEARAGWFPVQPGHWLLVADGLARLVGYAAMIATMLILADEGKRFAQYYAHFSFLMAVAPCYAVVFVVALQTSPLPKRWRLLLWLLLADQSIKAFWSVPLFFDAQPWRYHPIMPWQITPYALTLETLVLIAAVVNDFRTHEPRDWLHHVAIVIWLLEWVMYLVWYGVQMYG